MFDSDGGLTMSLLHGENRIYVHFYDDMEQAAGDLREFLNPEYSVELWDGNMLDDDEFDPDDLNFDGVAERSGAAFWATEIPQIKKSVQIYSWKNVQDFMEVWEPGY